MMTNCFRKMAGSALAAITLAAWAPHSAMAEPLMTMFAFSQAAYKDGASNEIVVTIKRTDQDPATENETFTVKCVVTGGDATENQDFTLGFNGSMWEFGKVRFLPGV